MKPILIKNNDFLKDFYYYKSLKEKETGIKTNNINFLFFVIVEFIFILSIYILIKVKFRGLKGL